ncbi:hypothetical protein DAPPUDRAFT_249500 [Daphnia pulex]|uniref:Uncharacterized protein n=1 Tax=Daphnia pulex TaxID=6669 RepID=E9GWS3_DAPPU|nr:hypothetical protein DAPPUDRAFT_249500 [Daphnia pulex]|eukprot:EFX75951.1 hypothetical protein DAPPUDRAFT_249500 [Daphnia pulex]
MLQEIEQRKEKAPSGRNTSDLTKQTSNSQEYRKKNEMENLKDVFCAFPGCETNLGTQFSLECATCHQWYHGSCIDVSREIAFSMDY